MLNPSIITGLRDIVGTDGISPTGAIATPRTADEVARVLALAADEGVPVTPRGTGAGVSDGSVAPDGGLIVSTAGMDRIVSASSEDLIAVVEPGIRLDVFQRHLDSLGLFYPPDCATLGTRTLGGMVGESTRGLRAVKYGSTRNYVLGMKIALASGEILKTGARTLKCVTGYDLASLFTGSLGTLGVCTELYLKLLPSPELRVAAVAVFDDPAHAARASLRILEAGVVPSILELVDRPSIEAAGRMEHDMCPGDADALLLVETDGLTTVAERSAASVEDICCASGAKRVVRITDPERAGALWRARRSVFAALCRERPWMVLEELRIQRTRVVEMTQLLEGLKDADAGLVAVFGHVGDGRLHVALSADVEDSAGRARVERGVDRIAAHALSLGARLGPERVVPRGGTHVLKQGVPSEQLDLMKRLKEAFDPAGVMNPGNLF